MIVNEIRREVFPRVGAAMPPVPSFLLPDGKSDLMKVYNTAAKDHFQGQGIALSVVRANLRNRIEHVSRSQDRNSRAIIESEGGAFPLSPVSRTSPEERAEAFIATSAISSSEVHAELLTGPTRPAATDFQMAHTALLALSYDFDGTTKIEDARARVKITRQATIDGQDFVVVRSKIDGLKAEFESGEVELKLRRSGAVALNAVVDSDTKRAMKVLANAAGDFGVDESAVEYHRELVEEYLSGAPDSYTPFVQSYYLSRPL